MKTLRTLLVSLTLCTALLGCKTRTQLLPNVSGKAGEVYVITEKAYWEGSFGAAVKEVLATDCPYLPQPEPLYDLTNITPSNFTNMFKMHRNLIVANVDPGIEQGKVEYRYDLFARPQIAIGLTAPSAEALTELFKANSEKITSAIEQMERDRIIANSMKYEESSLRALVEQDFGATMYFPSGYKLLKRTPNLLWISYKPNYLTQGIVLYRYPADGGDKEFTVERLVAKRNEILGANMPGMFENSYMTTSKFVTPGLKYVRYKGREFAAMSGLWEVENDYMGGPFVSHSFYSPDGSEIICVEGFVFAPKYDKRHYLRQVESIVYSYTPIVNDDNKSKNN